MDELGVTEVVLDEKSKLKKSLEELEEDASNSEGLLNALSDVCIASVVVGPAGISAISAKVSKPKFVPAVTVKSFGSSICMNSSFVSSLKLRLGDGAKSL